MTRKRYKIGIEASTIHVIEADSYEEAERKAKEESELKKHQQDRAIPLEETPL